MTSNFKGKTGVAQEAAVRTVSGLMASEITLLTCVTMRERVFTATAVTEVFPVQRMKREAENSLAMLTS